jgi:RND family efflux transporter MFP subunit
MKARTFGLLSIQTNLYLLTGLFITSLFLAMPLHAQKIETKVVTISPIVKKINRTGKLTFRRTANLSFKTGGYLEKLTVDEGDYFVKGQVLAQLENDELKAEKNASFARLRQAKQEVKRVEALLSKNLSSQQALDDANTLVETTRSSHQIAEYNLVKAKIIAPFDGVVLSRFTDLGELQSPNQRVLQLAATENNLIIRVALPANEVQLIKLNQVVKVDLNDVGLTRGTISKIPAIADEQSHLFSVEILLTSTKATQVVVGQLAYISTEVLTRNLAYKLPIEALNSVDNQGRALVMVQDKSSEKLDTYNQQAFSILQLSNDYIYLSSQPESKPLTVVTRGWQHLALPAKQIDQIK